MPAHKGTTGHDRPPLRETDLYEPIRTQLEAQGYSVRSEVRGCDIVAVKDNDLVAIEIKRSFSSTLLFQATERQKVTDSVYVAIPRQDALRSKPRWKGIKRLLERLELGLILVDLSKEPPWVDISFHPTPHSRRHNPRERRSVLREAAGRSLDLNLGGSTGKRLVTAYRENCIHIACCLRERGPLSPRQLRAMGTGKKTTSILGANFYGWFERIDRALYRLSPAGEQALPEYPELVKRFQNDLRTMELGPSP